MEQSAETAPGRSEPESDFSVRKMKLATVILIAQVFCTSLLPFIAITFVALPMQREFGWTATEFAFSTTALMWCGGATNPFYGKAIDSVGVRPLVMFGTLGVALITYLLSFQTNSLLMFYGLFALLGMFGSSAIGYSKVISALFTQHRGKALAIIGAESTLAAAAVPYIVHFLIEEFGWRGMFQGCALIILAIVPLLYFQLDEPGSKGGKRTLFPKREKQADGSMGSAPRIPQLPGLTGKEILRDRIFWMVVIATIIGTAPRSGLVPHIGPMLISKGFREGDIATYLSVATAIGFFGTLAGGWAADRYNTVRVAVPFKMIMFIGMCLLMVTTSAVGGFPLLMLATGFMGFSFGTSRPLGTYFHIRFFGLKSFGFYHGFEMMLLAFAMGIAAPLVGWAYDTTGNFDMVFIVMNAMLLVGALMFLLLGPYRYAHNVGEVPEGGEAAPAPPHDHSAQENGQKGGLQPG